MATFVKVNSFTEDLAKKKHDFGSDQFMIALCTNANAPVVTNTVLANLTQISYTNLSSRVVTVTSATQTSGQLKVILADLTLTASGAVPTFRWIVVYNNTATNKELVGFIDTGADQTMNNIGDTFLIDFDGVNGTFTIG